MNPSRQTLFDLLPALYRLRDAQFVRSHNQLSPAEETDLLTLQATPPPLTAAQQTKLEDLTAKSRGPLEALLTVIEEQMAVVAEDINQFYDNQFIETCAPWVIPYLGDLIGYQSVHGIAPSVASPRAEVAHTISFRRRKGTILVLEQLARDVTGWGAHAVEFFKLLAVSQYMNHIRPFNHYAPDLRRWQPHEYVNTGFDATSHTVDVRRIAIGRGRYNIQNIGIFLWTLNSSSVTKTPATPVAGNPTCFRFSSLGCDIALFNRRMPQGPNITAAAQPPNVPDRLRRHVLCQDISNDHTKMTPVYYGDRDDFSLALYFGDTAVDISKIQVCDLSGDDGSWHNLPLPTSPFSAAIDPQLGRIALPAAPAANATLRVTYHYGFNAEIGGGEYARASSFKASPEAVVVRVPNDKATIHEAIAALPGKGVVEITNSDNYSEPAGLNINVSADGLIELRAADSRRPTLVLGAEIAVVGGLESTFEMNGLVITYAPPTAAAVTPKALIHASGAKTNHLGRLGLSHCTLVPGWALLPSGDAKPAFAGLPTVLVETPGVQVTIEKSIIGGLWVAALASSRVTDSIIDSRDPSGVAYVGSLDDATRAPHPGGELTLEGCTVIGKVYASLLQLVTDSLIWAWLSDADLAASPRVWSAPLWAALKQKGCVRFSYLPADSLIARQYECVEQGKGVPEPMFYSLRYGDPGYAKLVFSTDDMIRRGADDGGEMGAFHFLLAPLRETDLRVRLQEYMPVGLEFGIFYEN
jgi:hypothetical protein